MCLWHWSASSYNIANKRVCVFFQDHFLVDQLLSIQRARVCPEGAAEDRMTSRAAAKTSDKLVGSPQKRVSGSARKADRVDPGTTTLVSISDEK